MAEEDNGRRLLSDVSHNGEWVNLWHVRDDEWQSFIGRIADDGAVEYPHGGRSLHNTVTHWSPLSDPTGKPLP